MQIRTALIAALLEDLERGDLDVVLGPSTASQPGTWRRQSWPTSTSSSSPQKRIHQRRSAH
ncbi:hypothetical protein [Arsenicicoccus piscis]|uniref:hypothetical protein n=1 Tax=Arsenicicoccus piscis TaxID=673954 RepID=UPI0024E14F02|nr:hypothetical protein [Arsenicicoccus piscis]